MRVRLVCYEEVNGWILGKFAMKMQENLTKLNIDSDISKLPDPSADINHHIIYYDYKGEKNSTDTLMITHIDSMEKLDLLKEQMKVASVGICMSNDTMNILSGMGIDSRKLCFINPAQDGVIQFRKIVIGISCRVQEDGRKREYFLDKLSKALNPTFFKFRIMGDNWDSQINTLRKNGFEVDYFDHFEYNEYLNFIPSLDYYLYTGLDEGQMGFVDAIAAGIKTIVTAQGYHLDAANAITHPFTTYEELETIFLALQSEKEILINSITTWNWLDYTKKHLEVWNYLLDGIESKSDYSDGLNSLLRLKTFQDQNSVDFIRRKSRELRGADYLQYYYVKKRRFNEIRKSSGLKGLLAALFRNIFRFGW